MKTPRWWTRIGQWLRSRGRQEPPEDPDRIEFVDAVYDLGIDPRISREQQIKDWCIATKILSQDAIEFLRGNYGACSEDLLIERFETLIHEIEELEETCS